MSIQASNSTIKWTDEEWRQIALRLVSIHGTELMFSKRLEQIKARNVFDAQVRLVGVAMLERSRDKKITTEGGRGAWY